MVPSRIQQGSSAERYSCLRPVDTGARDVACKGAGAGDGGCLHLVRGSRFQAGGLVMGVSATVLSCLTSTMHRTVKYP